MNSYGGRMKKPFQERDTRLKYRLRGQNRAREGWLIG